jgi:hypothetical protein
MAKKIDLKQLEKIVKKAESSAKKTLANAVVKDPKKKQRAATIKELGAAAKLDDL